MVDFGKVLTERKKVCYEIPSAEELTLLNNQTSANDEANALTGKLNFGKTSLNSFEITLNNQVKTQIENTINQPNLSQKINFGNDPNLLNLDDQLKNLSLPRTICITIGGGVTLSDTLDQISNSIRSITSPINIPNPLQNISIPTFKFPGGDFQAFPFLPLPELNASQLLSDISNDCANILLDKLNQLDPLERIKQLLDKLEELCGLLRLEEMRAIIDRIQQAKAELVQNLINKITDPAQKIAKLMDMAIDAINSGAYDMLAVIAALIDSISFQNIINIVQQLNPREAIAALSALLQQQLQLRNIKAVRQILSLINQVKAGFNQIADIGNSLLDIPEMTLDQLQSKVDELLNLENYTEIEKLLTAFEISQDKLIQALRDMDPATALQSALSLLQNALQRLDVGQFTRVLQELANKLCQEGADLIPTPTGTSTNIPGFLTK